MRIEKTEIMTNEDLISWLRVLGEGYVKPDIYAVDNQNTTGVVKDTAQYMPFIMSINSELCRRAGVDCPDVSRFLDFKDNDRERKYSREK